MIDLTFNRVSKKYRIQVENYRGESSSYFPVRLTRLIPRQKDFWALKDVSFQVTRGETLGIIGRNGAGKSTVLKLLSRISAPTSGEITINGRLSALIEVGSGFHPDLTGRENVYLSGSILGMRRREIARKLDSIIDFAGVREFIDTPVKRYSSGMYVRLGFSIAAHLHPDILLLDEVLAVGDSSFQTKCYDRISELKKGGTTIVFISHDLNAVEFLCDRALLLDGKIVGDGLPIDVIRQYEGLNGFNIPTPESRGAASKLVQITRLTFRDYEGRDLLQAFTGKPLAASVEFVATESVEDLVFEICYYSHDGRLHCQFSTSLGTDRIEISRGRGTVEFYCDELGLQPGLYYADATIRRRTDGEEIDWLYRSAVLRVDAGKTVPGKFYTPHNWRLKQHDHTVSTAPELFEQAPEFQKTNDCE